MKLDLLTIHSDDMGAVLGQFQSIPVREWNPLKSLQREDNDMFMRLAAAKVSEEAARNAVPAQE